MKRSLTTLKKQPIKEPHDGQILAGRAPPDLGVSYDV